MGTGVTCPTFRYRPAVVAQTWASLSLLAPGRVFLGVGLGENLNEGASGGGWGDYEERCLRFGEAIDIIRQLWTGKEIHIEGQFWTVEGKLYDPPTKLIPIFVAAGAPKSARLAGLYGDGLVTGSNFFKSNSELKENWEAALRENGKDPKTQSIILEHWAMPTEKEEALEAASKWRFMAKAWKPGYFDNISPTDIQARAEREIQLDQVLNDWVVSSDPNVHIDAINELARLGATHVALHVPANDQMHAIDFFGRKVLPALKTSQLVYA